MSNDAMTPRAAPKGKAERAQASRQCLVGSARRLFETLGYAQTSTEALLAETGLTRGALYHHFRDKRALFEAVCEAIHAELVEAIEVGTAGVSTPVDNLRAGAHAWLTAVAEPRRARVLLVDAPSVLGMEAWSEADGRHGHASLRTALLALPGATPASADALGVALNGAMNELARWVAMDATRLSAACVALDALIDAAALAIRGAPPLAP